MIKKSTAWALIGLGTMPNILLTFFFVSMAKAGHSPLAFLIGIVVPFIALFCYLGYLNFSKDFKFTKKRLLFLSLKPSILISSIILLLMLELFSWYGDIGFFDWFGFLIMIELIIVLPNLGVQFLIFYRLKKHIKTE